MHGIDLSSFITFDPLIAMDLEDDIVKSGQLSWIKNEITLPATPYMGLNHE